MSLIVYSGRARTETGGWPKEEDCRTNEKFIAEFLEKWAIRGPNENWKEFHLRTGLYRPPKYIRDKAKGHYETPAVRERREAREDMVKTRQEAVRQEINLKKLGGFRDTYVRRSTWASSVRSRRLLYGVGSLHRFRYAGLTPVIPCTAVLYRKSHIFFIIIIIKVYFCF